MTRGIAQDMGVNVGKFIGLMIWEAAPWILLWTVIGFIAAIFLTVFLARREWLRRHTYGWNLAAKLGYVVVLLTLPIGAGVIAGVYTVHSKVNAGIDSGLRPIVAAQMPPLRAYLAEEMRRAGSTEVTTIREMIKPFKQRFMYVATSDGRWERYKRYWINDIMVEPSFTILADTIEDKLLEKLDEVGAKVAGDQERARQIFSLTAAILVKQNSKDPADAIRFDREITQVVMGNLFKRIDQGFSPVYMSIALTLLGIASLMVLEIVLYRRFYWPGRASVPVGVHPPLAD